MDKAAEKEEFSKLLELVNADKSRIALAKKRHAAVFKGEKPDRWPFCLNAKLTPEQDAGIPRPPKDRRKLTFRDRLTEWLRVAAAVANARSDAIPFIYAQFGTAPLLACIGLEQDLSETGYWPPEQRLTREQIAKLSVDDIQIRGTFKEGMEYLRYVREMIGDAIDVCWMDGQSPFDLAHLIMGDEIFIALIDDPPLVRHLLDVCLELYIRAIAWMKEDTGEPMNGANIGTGGWYSENWGVQLSEDTSIMLSPEMVREFTIPYGRRAVLPFGGGGVHYCGRHDGLTDAILEAPEFKYINFGMVPGKLHDQPYETIREKCLAAGKIYLGSWPIRPGETGKAYLKRLWDWASLGGLIPAHIAYDNIVAAPGNAFASPADVLDYWYGLG